MSDAPSLRSDRGLALAETRQKLASPAAIEIATNAFIIPPLDVSCSFAQ
jgi:hypothetical protein